jgi:hypothetical protein
MKSFLTALVLAAALVVSSCASLREPGGLDALIKQVQSITQQACAFIPTAQTVANILAAGQLNGAFVIANAICAAVVAPPDATRRRAPMVSGVPVNGSFVRR